jgi:twitching motility protein PilI
MPHRKALRDLQTRLVDQLQEAKSAAPGRSWLAVESAGHSFLFPLTEAGEIFPMVPLMPMPHAQPWFLGVANLRGHLHGVVDLGRFLGLVSSESVREPTMLVAFSTAFEVNAALRVDRLAGLRAEADFSLDSDVDAAAPSFVGQRLRDAGGRVWQEIRLAALVRHEAFLKIVG